MIYIDSSALLKLLHEEPESVALETWLLDRASVPLVTSELSKVEVVRASRRIDERTVPAAKALLRQIDLVPLTGGVSDAAADVGTASLRSLDALHLASALAVRADVTAFAVYDHRLRDAAKAEGFEVVAPGA